MRHHGLNEPVKDPSETDIRLKRANARKVPRCSLLRLSGHSIEWSMVSDKPRFVTCCSQVFDGDGAGLEFVAYDANEVEVQRDNPYLSRNEMFRVMTRSLGLYQR